MRIDGSHFDDLLTDLHAALAELAAAAPDAATWSRGVAGKWTAGQHVDHIATVMELTADRFDEARTRMRAGTLEPRPRRGLVQRLWVSVAKRGMPRGGKTIAAAEPGPTPDRTAVIARMAAALERHRAAGADLSAADRDRLWVANPFMPRWHYNLPEMIRVHAVHARHHAHLVAEIADSQAAAATPAARAGGG